MTAWDYLDSNFYPILILIFLIILVWDNNK
jgi:hypothetical protein